MTYNDTLTKPENELARRIRLLREDFARVENRKGKLRMNIRRLIQGLREEVLHPER